MIAAASITKIVKRAALDGPSMVVRWSTIARAVTVPAKTVAGTAISTSLRTAGPDALTRRVTQIAASVTAAVATNQRSVILTACANEGSERTRKLLTVQFAQQPGSKYGSLNSARPNPASSASRYTT